MSQLNSQLRFNADGTPRRRYELDQAPEGRAALATTIGLVLASTVALVKNVMFPAHALEPAPIPGYASADAVSAPIESGTAQSDSDIDPLRTQTSSDDVAEVHAPVVRASLPEFKSVPVPTDGHAPAALHAASSHLASNDNKALYGAAPGRAVHLDASDAFRLFPNLSEGRGSRASTGGGGGGGGGGDGDTLQVGQRVPAHDGDDEDGGDGVDPTKPLNRAPVVTGQALLGNRFINQVLVIGLSDLLVNATDADADRLSVSNLTPSSGTIVANPDGGWSYMPDPASDCGVTFTYTVSDGHASVAATATLLLDTAATGVATLTAASAHTALIGSSVPVTELRDDYVKAIAATILKSAAPIIGTAGDDVITGTHGNDVIWAGSGDDVVDGGDGDDEIHGEAGNDALTGGKGKDAVSGDGGDDTFVATLNDGDDTYDGGDGEDTLDLTALWDNAAPEAAAVPAATATAAVPKPETAAVPEPVTTVPKPATVAAPEPATTTAPEPVTVAAPEPATVAAPEPVTTAPEPATVAVPEPVTVAAPEPATVAAPEPVTVAAPEPATVAAPEPVTASTPEPVTAAAHVLSPDVHVDLEAGTADSELTGHDEISNIENVKTGKGDDTIIGNEHDNKLSSGAGDDFIDGKGGNDKLDGGAGSDIVKGGDGNDVIVATADAVADVYQGGQGSDTYDASKVTSAIIVDLEEGNVSGGDVGNDTISDIENVNGGGGGDTIIANDEVNIFTGGQGDDMFVFHTTASIGKGSGGHDKILDFAVGDKIDISDISKEFADKLDDMYKDHDIQKFVFISNADVFSKPGQLKVTYDEEANSTVISGNIDFDDDAEFELELVGKHQFSDTDFNHH